MQSTWPLLPHWWAWKLVQPFEVQCTLTGSPSNPAPGFGPRETKTYAHIKICTQMCVVAYNHQNLEAAHVPWRVRGEQPVHPYDGSLLSHKGQCQYMPAHGWTSLMWGLPAVKQLAPRERGPRSTPARCGALPPRISGLQAQAVGIPESSHKGSTPDTGFEEPDTTRPGSLRPGRCV